MKAMHKSITRRFALAAALGLLTLPSVSAASQPTVDGDVNPVAATDEDDPPCGQAVIALTFDVDTGDLYIQDGATGGLVLTDNIINVHFGTNVSVLLDIEYTHSEWEVTVAPGNDPDQVFFTRGGTFRYKIGTHHSQYVISSDIDGPDDGSTETPILPEVIVIPVPDCPPET